MMTIQGHLGPIKRLGQKHKRNQEDTCSQKESDKTVCHSGRELHLDSFHIWEELSRWELGKLGKRLEAGFPTPRRGWLSQEGPQTKSRAIFDCSWWDWDDPFWRYHTYILILLSLIETCCPFWWFVDSFDGFCSSTKCCKQSFVLREISMQINQDWANPVL